MFISEQAIPNISVLRCPIRRYFTTVSHFLCIPTWFRKGSIRLFPTVQNQNTKTVYVEANSDREVRAYLQDRNYNIELIQLLEGNYLEYEKNSPNFRLENA